MVGGHHKSGKSQTPNDGDFNRLKLATVKAMHSEALNGETVSIQAHQGRYDPHPEEVRVADVKLGKPGSEPRITAHVSLNAPTEISPQLLNLEVSVGHGRQPFDMWHGIVTESSIQEHGGELRTDTIHKVEATKGQVKAAQDLAGRIKTDMGKKALGLPTGP